VLALQVSGKKVSWSGVALSKWILKKIHNAGFYQATPMGIRPRPTVRQDICGDALVRPYHEEELGSGKKN
jgi:hypothetical protein